MEYKPNRTMKKLYKAVSDYVETVEFKAQDSSDLVSWIARRFRALDKEIDRQTAEYLIFTCGGLMTGLIPEIQKNTLKNLRRNFWNRGFRFLIKFFFPIGIGTIPSAQNSGTRKSFPE